MGKVHGSLARAGKVKAATPKVSSLRFPANATRYTIRSGHLSDRSF